MKRSKRKELLLVISSIIPSLVLLRKNDPLRLAGATAFFTTFALPFIVFILAQSFGLFIGPKIIGRGLIENIAYNLGPDGAQQVRQIIHSIRSFNDNWYVITCGFLFLLFVATTLFIVIKDSLNQIWQVTKKPEVVFNLGTRLKSFLIILLIGALSFANVFLKNIQSIGNNFLENLLHGVSFLEIIVNEIRSVIIDSIWFIILFRFLGDAQPKWKAAIIGGLLTGILFITGRFFLKILLVKSNIGHLYGPSGSFVLILLFVFYTSFIMYYGACFIAVYSEKKQWALTGN